MWRTFILTLVGAVSWAQNPPSRTEWLTDLESKFWPWPWELVARCHVWHTFMLAMYESNSKKNLSSLFDSVDYVLTTIISIFGSSNFVLILYIPVIHYSVMSGCIFLGWTSSKQRTKCQSQIHYTVPQWGSNLQPLDLESSTLLMSYYAPWLCFNNNNL